MPLLTNAKINEIKREIASSKDFTLDDFDLKFPKSGKDLVRISFIPFSDYSFTIQEGVIKKEQKNKLIVSLSYDVVTEDVIKVLVSPGEYKTSEVSNHNDISDAIHKISNWLLNIRNELKYISIDINEVKNEAIDEIKESLDKSFPNEKEMFTNDEVKYISEKLNFLQSQVNKLEDELKITKEENKRIQIIFEQSAENLAIYPKKAWYFTTLNKLKSINSDIKILLDVKDNISNMIDYFK